MHFCLHYFLSFVGLHQLLIIEFASSLTTSMLTSLLMSALVLALVSNEVVVSITIPKAALYTRADAQKFMDKANTAHAKTKLAIANSEKTRATGFKAWFMKHFQKLIKFVRSLVN